MSFPKGRLNKKGYPYWEGHPAKELLEVDVARGHHKTKKLLKLRETRTKYKQFPASVFQKWVGREDAKQKAAAFWADKRNKKGMKKFLKDVKIRAEATI